MTNPEREDTSVHVTLDTDDVRMAAEWLSGMLRDATDEREAAAVARETIAELCSNGCASALPAVFSTVAGIYALSTATDRPEAPRDALTKLAAFLEALAAWKRHP